MNITYKSLYPSITLENNIAPNTQLGRIVIDETVYKGENAYMNPKYSRGGEFVENMVTDNHLSFCKRWFHLTGIKEFLEDMNEYRSQFMISYSSNGVYDTYYYDKNDKFVVVPIRDNRVANKIRPLSFTNDRKIKPIRFYNRREVKL